MFHSEGPTLLELTRQALASTEHGYDLLAPKFDVTPFRTPAPLLEAAAPLLAKPGSVGSAVDLCCGTGAGLAMLRPLCRERLVGVDFSRGMLDRARMNLGDKTDSNGIAVEFAQADVLDFTETDLAETGLVTETDLTETGQFDLATCFSACGHIPRRDETRFVRGVARLLKPGGRFAFISSEKPPLTSLGLWLALTFNAVMRVRNALWRPPFIMYYLTFLLPQIVDLLEKQGFEVEVHRGFSHLSPWVHLVVATRLAETGAMEPRRPAE